MTFPPKADMERKAIGEGDYRLRRCNKLTAVFTSCSPVPEATRAFVTS